MLVFTRIDELLLNLFHQPVGWWYLFSSLWVCQRHETIFIVFEIVGCQVLINSGWLGGASWPANISAKRLEQSSEPLNQHACISLFVYES